jgi:hypothetical protein
MVPEPPAELLTAGPEALGALDDVDSGSPADCTLDSLPPTDYTETDRHGQEE